MGWFGLKLKSESSGRRDDDGTSGDDVDAEEIVVIHDTDSGVFVMPNPN